MSTTATTNRHRVMRHKSLGITAILTATFAVAPATTAFAVDTPAVTGCPASYEVRSVAELIALGYHAPQVIDEAGNANGLVCASQLPENRQAEICRRFVGACAPGDILYFFRDDTLTR
jgi:hypothetical protein